MILPVRRRGQDGREHVHPAGKGARALRVAPGADDNYLDDNNLDGTGARRGGRSSPHRLAPPGRAERRGGSAGAGGGPPKDVPWQF